MSCEELSTDYVLFALGLLEEPEKSELRAHLDRSCANCIAGLRDARAWTYALGASVVGPEPPKRLRRRILAAVEAPRKSRWDWSTAWRAAAITAMLCVGVFEYVAGQHAAETAELRADIARRAVETAGLRNALELLQSPETREVTFGQGKPAPPRGRVFVNSQSGVLLVASNLPAPPAGKTYEMWIIPKSGKPAPAGLFASKQDGTALYLYPTSVSLATTGAVAVTLEQAGGVDAPTSQPIIVAALD